MTKGVMRWMLLAIFVSSGTVVAGQIDRILVVSDSLSDTGNLLALTGNTFPPPIYFNGRFSNGDVWVDGVADQLGLSVNSVWGLDFSVTPPAPVVTPKGNGFIDNYAVAGSFTGSYTVVPPFGGGESVSNVFDLYQVLGGFAPQGIPGAFEQFGAYALGGIDPTATHVVWAGSNDLLFSPILDPTAPASGAALAAFAENAAKNVVLIASALSGAGVTDLVVLNLPDLGATPYADYSPPTSPTGMMLQQILQGFFPTAADLAAYLTQASQLFNAALASEIAGAGIDVIQFDLAASFQDVLNNPGAYGITDVDNSCLQPTLAGIAVCNDPDEFVFWDDVHPTSAVHDVLAGQLAAAVIDVPQPLLLLTLGLVIAAAQARRSRS